MSTTEVNKVVENEEENKTPDKKQIEAEEKEVMLKTDAENIVAVATEEKPKIEENEGPVKSALSTEFTEQGREVKPKFIPIGAIKMPGFFTRNSDKDKSKEEDTVEKDGEEKTDDAKPRRRLQFLHTCPFTQFLHHPHSDNENGAENPENPPRRVIRMPNLAALKPANLNLPKIFKNRPEKDPEAALASMETLEDKVETPNDGMENVKLDGDEVEGKVATKLPLKERIRQKKFIMDDIVVCGVVLLVLLCVIIGIIVGARAGPPAERPLRLGRYMTTVTSCGPVEGILNEGVYQFYSIPYAVPPVGARRFTYAQPLDKLPLCWQGTRAAHGPGALCLQRLANDTVVGEEDCLTLDVVTPHVRGSPHSISEVSSERAEPRRQRPWERPARGGPRSELPKKYDSPLPVVVLVGADSLAGGPGPLQPSPMYARTKEVVFVRPNFRLGALGFLALDLLSADKYPPTSGNYALSDLVAALDWVQRNVRHFGGDPAAVTLLGHRAGATLAAALTTVRAARALYSRAWLSSPSVIFPGEPLEQAQKANEEFKLRSKCGDAACLRRISSTEVLSATPEAWLASDAGALPVAGESRRSWLVLDGELLRVHAYEAWDAQLKAKRSGKEREFKPLVFGTTLHAAHSELLQGRHAEWSAADVEAAVAGSALAARDLFQHFNKTYEGLAALVSAVRTLCPLVSLARLRLGAPLYVAGAGGARLTPAAADVQAMLGTFDSVGSQQRRFMAAQQQLFYNFVWHGTLPAAADAGLLSVEQDVLPLPALPVCDLLIQQDLVPRYAHVD